MEQYEKDYRWRLKCKKSRKKYLEYLMKLHGGEHATDGKARQQDKSYINGRVENPGSARKLG